MIVVTLAGGLGNQMFQYAFGRGAATLLGRPLALDLSRLSTGEPPDRRGFDLAGLPLHRSVRILGRAGLRRRQSQSESKSDSRAGRFAELLRTRFPLAREPGLDVALAIDRLPRPVAICRGYWQSPGYFEHIEDEIRQELTPRISLGAVPEGLLCTTDGFTRIAVHVRRGDYVNVPGIAAIHGVQTKEYFEAAVASIATSLASSSVALIFSDDPEWAERELDFDIPALHVEARGRLSTVEALALMARCDHHVISNSSFSWWGAYLAHRPGQHVVYPERWFATRPIDPSFRFPASWRGLSSRFEEESPG